MMKKKILALLVSTCLIVMLTGCGSSDDTNSDATTNDDVTQETNTEEAAGTEDEITITVFCAYASEDPHGQYIYEYADAFMDANPNIKVEISATSSNDIYTKLAAMATTPDDLPVLFYTSADQAPSLYDLGMMEDLNNYLNEETLHTFAPGVIEASTLDNTLAFYPIDLQPLAVLYRIDRFQDVGLEVPTNWEEFLEASQELTLDSDGDGEIDQWGFSMVGSNNSSGQSRFMSYLWSLGFDLVSYDESTGEWVTDIESEEFLEAFTYWTDMNNVHGVVSTGITEVDYATAANYFAMEYTSMMMSGGNALGVSYANNPELEGKIGTFAIPGEYPGSMMNAEGYSVCAHASETEKEAAVEFLKFFTEYDSELNFWKTSGKLPATVSGLEAEYIQGDDYAGFVSTIEAGCKPIVNFPGMNGLKGIIGDAYSSVFSNESTNEEAVENLISELHVLLEDYN